ncbi:hypothetical protein PAHAL_2G052700 [Panicum hallii]|jgi:hypothetical protein|uniref:Uncharacterized protein n=1 Tax=Panicum hallii TaxID=206008 RepID=A0A2S3GWI4_9POAL|nr:hypothetical protein PAHAL_2G052700 [Panicum hallii]
MEHGLTVMMELHLSPLDSVAAVVVLLVGVALPDHDAAVVGRLLHHRHDAVVEVLGVHVADDLLRRRQPDVDPGVGVRRRPLVPLRLPVGGAVPVAVEPDVDAGDDPRGERPLQAGVRVPAPRRRRQLRRRPAAEVLVVAPQPRGQHIVVVGGALVDEEVDAVELRVAERAVHAAAVAGEVGEPEVVGEVRRGLGAGERVLAAGAADGEENEDALGLAVLDVGADGAGGVAGEVQAGLAVAEDAEEGDDDEGVGAGVAGLPEGALGLVPAPEHGHLPRLPRRRGWAGEEGEEGHREGQEGA